MNRKKGHLTRTNIAQTLQQPQHSIPCANCMPIIPLDYQQDIKPVGFLKNVYIFTKKRKEAISANKNTTQKWKKRKATYWINKLLLHGGSSKYVHKRKRKCWPTMRSSTVHPSIIALCYLFPVCPYEVFGKALPTCLYKDVIWHPAWIPTFSCILTCSRFLWMTVSGSINLSSRENSGKVGLLAPAK